MSGLQLTDLAHDVATGGLAAAGDRLADVLAAAESPAVTPLLVEVLADPTRAEVVRQRALGRILLELERGRRNGLSR